jgi:plastocyanin
MFTMLGHLFLGVIAITGEQMVQPAFAEPPIEVPVHGGHPAIRANGTVSQQPTAAAAEKVGGAKVSIANFTFTPAEITIAPGETVTWTNDDGAPHGLEYADGAAGTNLLLPGASFSRQFDRPGTYDYNCSVHPYMAGRVVVRAQ